ncbi:MAG TPA: 1-acyl-sn-glycerol-3-phosphate acyltransferase, partial [Candidatus Lustribacter sp.]|nr:1-acyl-sn-glycerol-3-phosphate acyltransferase [Candidatus Lustribacter sp.]
MFLLCVWVLGLLPLWLVLAAFVSRFVPGRWRALRLAWFAAVYLALEVLVLVALFALWVRAGFGMTIRSEVSIGRHYRLMAWFLRRVLGSARFTFGLRVERDASPLDVAGPRPVLVLSRHAGAGDSFLLVDGIVNGPHHRRPRIVLKDLLQLDPAIDVLLNRVGAGFVDSTRHGAAGMAQEIARLAAQAGARDAVVIFPEGANFTVDRRRRAIEKLEEIDRPDLAERARRMVHLLPPKPLGALTAIEAAPGATVVFVGHAGLEAMSSVRDIWRNLPMRHTVLVRAWVVPAENRPPAPEREVWLYDQWQ